MIKLFIWIFIAYGCTNILVFGSIFTGFKDFLKKIINYEIFLVSNLCDFVLELLSCVMCTSTWVGFFLSIFMFSPYATYVNEYQYFVAELNPVVQKAMTYFVDGLFASGIVWMVNSIVEWFEENRK